MNQVLVKGISTFFDEEEEVGLHGVLDAKGGEQGGESTGQIKFHAKAAKIKDSEGVLNFRLIFVHFRMESCSVK